MTEEEAIEIITNDNKVKNRVNGELLDFPEDGSTWRYYQKIIAVMIQQLAQREAEVTVLSELNKKIKDSVSSIYENTCKDEPNISSIHRMATACLGLINDYKLELKDSKATAEAFKAKVWNEARQEFAKEVVDLMQYGEWIYTDNNGRAEQVLALLKPEREVV
jgi:uncharacterized coiled-coil DUF342 family protein